MKTVSMKPVVKNLVRMVSGQCTSDSRLMVGVNFGRHQRSSHHKMSSQNLRLLVIENMDKGGKWMYEHQKGKGFH